MSRLFLLRITKQFVRQLFSEYDAAPEMAVVQEGLLVRQRP
jgi:hypothetical protein